MSAVEKLKKDLLNYFASVNSSGDHVLTIRDFNSQLMAMTTDPEERAALAPALEELVSEGLLVKRLPSQFSLTKTGAVAARAERDERSRTSPVQG
jgi:hypothetical protein